MREPPAVLAREVKGTQGSALPCIVTLTKFPNIFC